jgi:aspartate/methionine/tyrosine aminotransferase
VKPQDFALERYFAKYEFTAKHLLCASDPQAMTIAELLDFEPGARERFANVWLGYTESRGAPELRAAIASTYGDSIDASNVLVHAGAEEPLFAFMNVALSAGDHAVVHCPAYQSHYAVAEAIGASVSPWTGDEGDGWALDPDELERLVRPNTRVVLITSPHNPTGWCVDRERLEAIVAIARRHGLWLIADEVYRGLERDVPAAPAACEMYERAVSIGGTAKTYGLAGLRIGWLVTRDRALLQSVAKFKDYLTICNSAPSEFLATLALEHSAELLDRTRAIVASNLDELDPFFARHAGRFGWQRPAGGTTAFPALLGGGAERFCAGLVAEAGVLLLPGTLFDAGDAHFRIGYGRADLPRSLRVLEEYLSV